MEDKAMWLFLIFVAIPIIEIALFIQVGGFLGLWPTLAIVILTAMVGTSLMRAQGGAALQKLQASLQGNGNPADPLANGALILVAGLLLLTPGFFTDSVGLALLIPPVRARFIKFIARHVTAAGTVQYGFSETRHRSAANDTVTAEYEVLDDENPENRGDSGWTRPQ
ncbi:MAG TPA: FxsA family protein [Paracoccaceae bacterium]|nr:FxsA family protein [Paracoccaceae bacterium]